MVTNSLKSCSSCSFCWNVWAEDNCHFLYSFVATPSCQNLHTLRDRHRTLLSSLEDQQPCLYILIFWAKGISWFPRFFLGTYQPSFFLNNVMESGNGGISTEYGLLLPFFLTLALSLHSFRKNQPNVWCQGFICSEFSEKIKPFDINYPRFTWEHDKSLWERKNGFFNSFGSM